MSVAGDKSASHTRKPDAGQQEQVIGPTVGRFIPTLQAIKIIAAEIATCSR